MQIVNMRREARILMLMVFISSLIQLVMIIASLGTDHWFKWESDSCVASNDTEVSVL